MMATDLKDKIDTIVENHPTNKAIISLNGYLRQYFWDNYLRTTLGSLYLRQSNFIKAGKYLYFKNNPNEFESRAIRRFEESLNMDKLAIFNALINRSKTTLGMTSYLSNRIFNLIMGISEQKGSLPTDIVIWISNYVCVLNSNISNRNFD